MIVLSGLGVALAISGLDQGLDGRDDILVGTRLGQEQTGADVNRCFAILALALGDQDDGGKRFHLGMSPDFLHRIPTFFL